MIGHWPGPSPFEARHSASKTAYTRLWLAPQGDGLRATACLTARPHVAAARKSDGTLATAPLSLHDQGRGRDNVRGMWLHNEKQ